MPLPRAHLSSNNGYASSQATVVSSTTTTAPPPPRRYGSYNPRSYQQSSSPVMMESRHSPSSISPTRPPIASFEMGIRGPASQLQLHQLDDCDEANPNNRGGSQDNSLNALCSASPSSSKRLAPMGASLWNSSGGGGNFLPVGAFKRCLSSRRFLLALVIFFASFALILAAMLAFIFAVHGEKIANAVAGGLGGSEDSNAFLNKHTSWRDSCERKCHARIPFDVPPLLLISMDGFRADYLERELTPAVSRILSCGAQADYLIPSYPSKTFPNHYTIVTGLYPEAHGIVDNYFYDGRMPEKVYNKATQRDPKWYGGEPIWNTVMRNGKKSATFFWPGSEVAIGGLMPTYLSIYNQSTPFSKRVDKMAVAPSLAEDRAEVNIRVSGACSPIYLSRRGIEVSKYRPSIRFNPEKIQLIPKNPVIPGCVKIKAEGVEILKPVRNLIAEVEMRIGGSPDPNNPTLPCTKRIDDKVNQCPCAKVENACVFCDFCRQMKSQASRISLTEVNPSGGGGKGGGSAGTKESLEELCKCEVMQPGLYDIETEMCTPELDDAKQFIPSELQGNILDKTPISMFITVYLMDMQTNANESYLSAFGKAILQRRMAQSTVACFLMGLDVTLAGDSFGGGGGGGGGDSGSGGGHSSSSAGSSSSSPFSAAAASSSSSMSRAGAMSHGMASGGGGTIHAGGGARGRSRS